MATFGGIFFTLWIFGVFISLHLRTHSAMNPLIIRLKRKGFVRLVLLKRR